jgi:hypothetical protein
MCRLLATECSGFWSQAPSECREIGEQGQADPTQEDACFIYYDGCIATCRVYQQYGDPRDGGVDAGNGLDAGNGEAEPGPREAGVDAAAGRVDGN